MQVVLMVLMESDGGGGGGGPVCYLRVPRMRGPGWGTVMSAREGAVEDVQELGGRGFGVGGVGEGGGGRSGLQGRRLRKSRGRAGRRRLGDGGGRRKR